MDMIYWQGTKVSIQNNNTSQDNIQYTSNGMHQHENSYKKNTGQSVTKHKNAEHLNNSERNMLSELISQFEDITRGTVGDYRNMEVAFEMDKKHFIM